MDIIIKTFLSINMICRLLLVACLLSPSIFKSSMGTMTSRVKHQTFVLLLLLRMLDAPLFCSKSTSYGRTQLLWHSTSILAKSLLQTLFDDVHYYWTLWCSIPQSSEPVWVAPKSMDGCLFFYCSSVEKKPACVCTMLQRYVSKPGCSFSRVIVFCVGIICPVFEKLCRVYSVSKIASI